MAIRRLPACSRSTTRGSAKDATLENEIKSAAQRWYRDDRDAPLAYEPSLDDFLSPALVEAALMREVLPRRDFAAWLKAFLPIDSVTCEPPNVADRADAKQSHLDGLALSRAWCFTKLGYQGSGAAPSRGGIAACRRRALRRRALARLVRDARAQRGSSENPMRNSSTARAHWRPSRIAQTTSDWPRRMSPAANTFGTEVA